MTDTSANVRCIVPGCTNREGEGGFEGPICSPCAEGLRTQGAHRHDTASKLLRKGESDEDVSGHTPGPWGVEQTETTNWIGPMRRHGKKVAQIVASTNRKDLKPEYLVRNDADAVLLARAPSLAKKEKVLRDRVTELERALPLIGELSRYIHLHGPASMASQRLVWRARDCRETLEPATKNELAPAILIAPEPPETREVRVEYLKACARCRAGDVCGCVYRIGRSYYHLTVVGPCQAGHLRMARESTPKDPEEE